MMTGVWNERLRAATRLARSSEITSPHASPMRATRYAEERNNAELVDEEYMDHGRKIEKAAPDCDAVGCEVTDGVAWLTIDRPTRRNCLGRAVREGLWARIRRFNDDASAAVLVLTGSGDRAFCAGAHLDEMSDTGAGGAARDFVPVFERIVVVDKVTIAAVNGVAYAGGFLLDQMCDLVVAADSARFAITETKVGAAPVGDATVVAHPTPNRHGVAADQRGNGRRPGAGVRSGPSRGALSRAS